MLSLIFMLCLTKNSMVIIIILCTLSEAWSGVNWADLMASQGAFGTDFYNRSILRPKHRVHYRSGRPVIKFGPKDALGSHEIRPIHSASSLGQSIRIFGWSKKIFIRDEITWLLWQVGSATFFISQNVLIYLLPTYLPTPAQPNFKLNNI